MPPTANVRYLTRYMPQNVSYSPKDVSGYVTYHEMSVITINKCIIPRNVRYIII